MTITSVARWNGGSREAVLALGKQIKPIHAKYGGEARIEHIHTGPHAGQWLISISYPDWETYGTGKYEKCADCMAHCGYEPTAVSMTMKSPKEMLRAALAR